MTFTDNYLNEVAEILQKIDHQSIEETANLLAKTRQAGGRLFILGVGGSAASASHAVNDFRKLAGFEAYAPTDNVSELTARTNDEGWESVFKGWLEGSRIRKGDALLIFSVGGGNAEKQISVNLINAIQYAKSVGASVAGVVGRDGGYTAKAADACVLIPVVNPEHITPHTEAFHAVISHLLVSHPLLKTNATKWESTKQMYKAVFLDRDGVVIKARVINGRPYPAASQDEAQITPGFDQVLHMLHDEGYLLIVVTNQPDVARGTQTREVVESINQFLLDNLPIEKVYTCYHDNADGCDCRKPKPGLLLQAAREYDIDLNSSYMVGDRWSDIEAGNAAGCKTIYIHYGYEEKQALGYNFLAIDPLEITEIIIGGLVEANR